MTIPLSLKFIRSYALATFFIQSIYLATGHACYSLANKLAPYLFPCAIEYSLISGAIFYKMFQRIGHLKQESERLEKSRKVNSMTKGFSECHRSHRGLFIGLLLFMATLVSMSVFFIFSDRRSQGHANPYTAVTIYQGTELVLLASSLLTSGAAFIRLKTLKFKDLTEEGAFDDNLLLIGLVGMLFYDMFLLVPAMEAINEGIVARLFIAKSILEMIQAIAQVFFILEASRRCAGSVEHVRKKPGRTLVVLLLITNLAMWVVNTFEVKRASNNDIHMNYFTPMVWGIITHVSLPLIIFFRFHSTVCLSDIWSNAYKFRSE